MKKTQPTPEHDDHAPAEEIKPLTIDGTLRAFVDQREQIQKMRIRTENQVRALEQGVDNAAETKQYKFLVELAKRYKENEHFCDLQIGRDIKRFPIAAHAQKIKGLGPMLTAKVVCMIDIHRCETVSALWRYAGYAVTRDAEGKGTAQRLRKGEKADYNKRLKLAMHLIGKSFIKSNSPYRKLYDNAKLRAEQTHPDWTPGHRATHAERIMVKMFMSHLWQVWREMEGLPTREPYAIASLGHTTLIPPEEYGWPNLAVKPKQPK